MIAPSSVELATENSCYMLPTETEEESCLVTADTLTDDTSSTSNGSSSESSDCTNVATGLGITGIVFGALGLMSCAYIVGQMKLQRDGPLASTDATAGVGGSSSSSSSTAEGMHDKL